MAVRQVVIHECDLCGAHVQPAQLTKIAVGFDKYDACPGCTLALNWAVTRLSCKAVEDKDWSNKTAEETYQQLQEKKESLG